MVLYVKALPSSLLLLILPIDDSSSIKLALLQKDELLLEKSADFDDLQADRVKIEIISIVTEINRLN